MPLPRLIILVIDDEVLRTAAYYNFGSSKILGKVISYLVKKICNIVETRKMDVRAKKVGAAMEGEPKLIWMKILYKPYKEKILNLCNKYNAILEETLTSFRSTYCMEIKSLNGSNFDATNKLTGYGAEEFWRLFNRKIKEFDRSKDEFLPKKVVTQVQQKASKHRELRFLLPRLKHQ